MALNMFKQPSVQDLVRDVNLRKALADSVVGAVKNVQMEAHRNQERTLMQCDVTNRLSEVVEAIFLHGFKIRLTKMMSGVFGGSKLPKPDFWELVMLYTHRDDLNTLSSLTQISSDVGRCRAWIRLIINDGTLSSFIECISQDSKALPSFYRSSAFLRDPELVAIVVRLLSSLPGHVKIALPLNVPSLNVWHKQPLLMSGFCKRDNAGDVAPVLRGVDVDDYFSSDASPTSTETVRKSSSHRLPIVRVRTYDDTQEDFGLSKSIAQEIEQALEKERRDQSRDQRLRQAEQEYQRPKVVLSDYQRVDDDTESKIVTESQNETDVRHLLDDLQLDSDEGFRTLEEHDEPMVPTTVNDEAGEPEVSEDSCLSSSVEDSKPLESNSNTVSWASGLVEQSQGWSSPFTIPHSKVISKTSVDVSTSQDHKQDSCESEEVSFDSILNSYTKHITAAPVGGTPELSNMLSQVYGTNDKLQSSAASAADNVVNDVDDEDADDDFEVIPKPDRQDERTLELLENIGRIPKEFGLDEQNFECFGCKCSIGMIFGPYRKCALDGHLYCQECFCGGSDEADEEHVVPARVVHNWDLKASAVCRFNKKFLLKYEREPLLDIREMNPILYSIVPQLEAIQLLRRQLGFLRLYLFSCSDSVSLQLQKMFWPREYLYEHVHQYSTLDLLSVSSGALQRLLEKASQFAGKHVISCQLCAQKGFICELCNDPKVIYPFNMIETHFCELCSALYHRKCLQEHGNSCKKCERRRIRSEKLARLEQQDVAATVAQL